MNEFKSVHTVKSVTQSEVVIFKPVHQHFHAERSPRPSGHPRLQRITMFTCGLDQGLFLGCIWGFGHPCYWGVERTAFWSICWVPYSLEWDQSSPCPCLHLAFGKNEGMFSYLQVNMHVWLFSFPLGINIFSLSVLQPTVWGPLFLTLLSCIFHSSDL